MDKVLPYAVVEVGSASLESIEREEHK